MADEAVQESLATGDEVVQDAWRELTVFQQAAAWEEHHPEYSKVLFALATASLKHEWRMDWAYLLLRFAILAFAGAALLAAVVVAWRFADHGQAMYGVSVLVGGISSAGAIIGTRVVTSRRRT